MKIYLFVVITLILLGLAFKIVNMVTEQELQQKLPTYFYIIPSFVLLFFISTFRGDFTTDYKNYSDLFSLYNKYSFIDLLNADFQNEIGFIYLNKITGLFTDDVIYFFAIMTFVILFGFFHHFKKYSVNLWLSVLMFVTAGSYYASFNITRHIFAVAIVFVGSKFLYERKFFKWVLVVIIASLFHKTAIIMIPFYFILNFRIRIRNWILIVIGSVITILLFDNIVQFAQQYFYEQYTDDSYGMWGQAITNAVLPISFLTFCLFNIKKIDPKNTIHRIWFNAVIFYAFFNVLALQVEMVERIGRFFAPYALLLIPFFFSKMQNKHLRVIYMLVLIFTLVLYNYVILADSVFDPYYFIWDVR
ncbi:EpsG family protein [Pseudogracilibacillus sp. SO30301A]|uniref:EpsG family protein n=1 Tax=Pseudogracilibacillus sp. SO30301A TaxID=3098291 RepID=UPI00300E696A